MMATLTKVLAQVLSRLLKLSAFIRRFPFNRLINDLFAFLFRRWTRTNPCKPAPHQRQVPPASSSAEEGVVCAMNIPSLGPSDDTHGRGRPSPTDLPYTSTRSPSGHLVPYNPALTRRYSRDHTPWVPGSQTSLREEPNPMDHDSSQGVLDSMIHSNSSTSIHTHYEDQTSNTDVNPLHRTISFTVDVPPENTRVGSSPRAAHIHFDTNQLEAPRSTTPASIRSSQMSVSRRSFNSRISTGRASYREHRGPPARVRTPVPDQDTTICDPSASPTLGRPEPGDCAIPPTVIVPPIEDDPSRPGVPISVGHRFFPISVTGVLRYDNRKMRCGV